MDSFPCREIYLDNNATTKPLPEVREVMVKALGENYGNPSSAHSTGDRARHQLIHARKYVANLIGSDPSPIIFTGSGTEANNLAFSIFLLSLLHEPGRSLRLITTTIEHSSVLKMSEHLQSLGVEVVYLPVGRNGRLCPEYLREAITPDTDLVSIQWVNNETGVIQPIEEIGRICLDFSVPFHTDAAQAVGKLPLDVSSLPIDYLSLTAHKFHGPQGVGALYAKDGRTVYPLFFGGSQEDSLRPGTENLPGIVGLGRAALLRCEKLPSIQEHLQELRDHFENRVLETIPDVEVNGDRDNRVCNTSNLLFRNVDGQALLARLDQEGIQCSQSSACTNQLPEASYVLKAMELSEQEAYSSIRFSFSELNTSEEIDYAVEKIAEICKLLRRLQARKIGHLPGVN